jgi:hypothetical protein
MPTLENRQRKNILLHVIITSTLVSFENTCSGGVAHASIASVSLFSYTHSSGSPTVLQQWRSSPDSFVRWHIDLLVYSVSSCGGYRGMLGQPECRVLAEALGDNQGLVKFTPSEQHFNGENRAVLCLSLRSHSTWKRWICRAHFTTMIFWQFRARSRGIAVPVHASSNFFGPTRVTKPSGIS